VRANRRILAGLVVLVWVASGCCHLPANHRGAGRPPLPAAIAASFDYPKTNQLVWRERVLGAARRYNLKRIELPAVPQAPGATRSIVLDCYQPLATNQTPVILVLPILGGSYELEEHFADYFARHGLAAVIVHRERMNPSLDSMETFDDLFRQTVLDNKQAIDWLETQPAIDPGRIGVFGVSMGGIKGALLVELDDRVQAAVLGLSGGDLPYILTRTTERGIVRRRKAWLVEHQVLMAELKKQLQQKISCDPAAFAPYVEPAKVLLVLAARDTVVPISAGLELRRKMGKPETIFLMAGHYSALVYIPYIQHQALKFYRKRFAAK